MRLTTRRLRRQRDRGGAVRITRLSSSVDEKYPCINWDLHPTMADLWIAIDGRHKSGLSTAKLLKQVSYRLKLNRSWPRVDCVDMVPGLAVSSRARAVFKSLKIPEMRFLAFRINEEPYFQFYTERCLDCLDRKRSDIKYFRSSPQEVKRIERYAFLKSKIRSRDLFTIPELSNGMFFWSQETYVTGETQAAIEKAGLIGFRFADLEGATEQGRP